jgi:hypothetical protein
MMQIGVDRGDRIRASPKAFQLRVIAVAAGSAAQDGPGEQPFTPEGHEPFGIEVPRMDRPQPHGISRAGKKLMIGSARRSQNSRIGNIAT